MLGCGAGGACSLSLFFSSLFLCQSCIPSLLFPFSLLFALSCTPLLQVAPSIPLSTPWHVFSICLFIPLPVHPTACPSLSQFSIVSCLLFFFFFNLCLFVSLAAQTAAAAHCRSFPFSVACLSLYLCLYALLTCLWF